MAQILNNVGQNEYLPYAPIQFQGAPGGQDYAEVGHVGIDVVNNVGYIAGNQVNGLQTWMAVAAATGTATTALTINPGNLVVTAGNETITAGNLTVSAGTITATVGSITAGTTVTAGTSIAATTSILAGTTITSTAGAITATNGNFVATAAGTGVTLGGGATITCGTGAPTSTPPQGSLYLRLDGSTTATRLYSRGVAGWIAITTAS
jgi:hypothetical protein